MKPTSGTPSGYAAPSLQGSNSIYSTLDQDQLIDSTTAAMSSTSAYSLTSSLAAAESGTMSHPYDPPASLEDAERSYASFELSSEAMNVYRKVAFDDDVATELKVVQVKVVDESQEPAAAEPQLSDSDAGALLPEGFSADKRALYLRVINEQKSEAGFTPENLNWNEAFQGILSKPALTTEQRLERGAAIRDLSLRFVRAANAFGKVIISEYALPAIRKTIKPLSGAGGIAGGAKYLHSNIFFKFPDDSHNLYGGDTFAMKSASHEARGIKMYLSTEIEGLHVPMMTCIDYKGRRLIASSVLPISGNTIIYGSADAGATILNSDPKLSDLMIQAAERLNLKGHRVGTGAQEKLLYGPADIEGHKGRDGRFYVVDTARVCPPEALRATVIAVLIPADESISISTIELSTKNLQQDICAALNNCAHPQKIPLGFEGLFHCEGGNVRNNRAMSFATQEVFGDAIYLLNTRGFHLYNMLRPEFVAHCPFPLSSDAYSGFGNHDRLTHNLEVREQTERLIQKVVPDFANQLDRKLFVPVHSSDLTRQMHANGMNVRLLGWLRANICDVGLRQLTLIAMAARVAKTLLRTKFRSINSANDADFKSSIVEYMNLLLGQSAASVKFWSSDIKVHILAKFDLYGASLSAAEMSPSYNLRSSFSLANLFQVLQMEVGVHFLDSVLERSQSDPLFFEKPNPLSPADIKEISSKVRPIHSDSHLLQLLRIAVNNVSNPASLTAASSESLRAYHKGVKRVFGIASLQHAQSWLSLAEQSVERNDLPAALKYTQKARFVFQHLSLPLDLGIMAAYLIAGVYFKLQYYAQARSCVETCIRILEQFGCENHVHYILSLNLLLECKLALGDHQNTRAVAEKFLQAWMRNPFTGNADLRKRLFLREVPVGLSVCVQELSIQIDRFLQFDTAKTSATVMAWLDAFSGNYSTELSLVASGMRFDLSEAFEGESERSRKEKKKKEQEENKALNVARDEGCLVFGSMFLGKGESSLVNLDTPTKFEAFSDSPHQVVCVKGSPRVMFALLSDGSVYSWGEGIPALGHGDSMPRRKPARIQALKTRRVVAIECNSAEYCEFALFLTATGEVFSVGHGSFGRLGHGDRVSRSTPRLINALRLHQIVQISAAADHCVALDSLGRVWTWGCNLTGQCGVPAAPVVLSPTMVSGLGAAAGRVHHVNSYRYSTIVLTESGWIYYWGIHPIPFHCVKTVAGENQKLPRYTDVPKTLLWTNVPYPRMIQAALGFQHIVLLDVDGKVWGLGANTKGQLGLGTQSATASLTALEGLANVRITQIRAAEDYSLAISDTGDVYQWGLGVDGVTRSVPVLISELKNTRAACIFPSISMWCVCSHTVEVVRPQPPYADPKAPIAQCGRFSVDDAENVHCDNLITLRYELPHYPDLDIIIVTEQGSNRQIYACGLTAARGFKGRVQFFGWPTLHDPAKGFSTYSVAVHTCGAVESRAVVFTFNVLPPQLTSIPASVKLSFLGEVFAKHGHINFNAPRGNTTIPLILLPCNWVEADALVRELERLQKTIPVYIPDETLFRLLRGPTAATHLVPFLARSGTLDRLLDRSIEKNQYPFVWAIQCRGIELINAFPYEFSLAPVLNDFGVDGTRWMTLALRHCISRAKDAHERLNVPELVDRLISRGWDPSLRCSWEMTTENDHLAEVWEYLSARQVDVSGVTYSTLYTTKAMLEEGLRELTLLLLLLTSTDPNTQIRNYRILRNLTGNPSFCEQPMMSNLILTTHAVNEDYFLLLLRNFKDISALAIGMHGQHYVGMLAAQKKYPLALEVVRRGVPWNVPGQMLHPLAMVAMQLNPSMSPVDRKWIMLILTEMLARGADPNAPAGCQIPNTVIQMLAFNPATKDALDLLTKHVATKAKEKAMLESKEK